MNKTEIFTSFSAFYTRPDKSVNGVSVTFAAENPYWEENNLTNTGCWECIDCYKCDNCTECVACVRCSSCQHCTDCRDCLGSSSCRDCVDADRCVSCFNCEDIAYERSAGNKKRVIG